MFASGIFIFSLSLSLDMQVNLPSQIVDSTRDTIRSCIRGLKPLRSRLLHDPNTVEEVDLDVEEMPPADLFATAKDDIVKLMKRDTFVRWKRTRFSIKSAARASKIPKVYEQK